MTDAELDTEIHKVRARHGDDDRAIARHFWRLAAERCAMKCDTYASLPLKPASENADMYRGFHNGALRCADACRAIEGKI